MVVIPDSIRDPLPRRHWIAGQARNDKPTARIDKPTAGNDKKWERSDAATRPDGLAMTTSGHCGLDPQSMEATDVR
jgi:hypothetical protein